MTELRKFGIFDDQEFRMALYWTLSPDTGHSDESRRMEIERDKQRPEYHAAFVEALRQFLLDDFLSLEEKVKEYFEVTMNENEAYNYFKEWWEVLAPDQPFPLQQRIALPLVTKV